MCGCPPPPPPPPPLPLLPTLPGTFPLRIFSGPVNRPCLRHARGISIRRSRKQALPNRNFHKVHRQNSVSVPADGPCLHNSTENSCERSRAQALPTRILKNHIHVSGPAHQHSRRLPGARQSFRATDDQKRLQNGPSLPQNNLSWPPNYPRDVHGGPRGLQDSIEQNPEREINIT